jgi:short subunit dehydrogenase-like uncharacterized protein
MNEKSTADARKFDIVVFGASGFTGRLVAEYLYQQYPVDSGLRWAVAGRNRAKLEEVLSDIGSDKDSVPVLIGDSDDRPSLDAITAQTRVVLTTVGPYAKYGSALVASCVANGSDYCDLAGEVQWIRKMIDEHQADAQSSGARIVPSCGFDSIPSDIGVHFLQKNAVKLFDVPCSKVSLLVRAISGGASGGTIASGLNAIEEARQDKRIARILTDPYSLNPENQRNGPDGRDQTGVRFNEALGVWTAPFVMGVVNMRIVRRSNALLGYRYGENFSYDESTYVGSGVTGWMKSAIGTAGLGGFMLASSFDLTREHLVKKLLPKPGDGPTKEQRENGYYNLILVGSTESGDRIQVRVKGDRDPGYGSTCKMLSESAVCLARDHLDVGGGFWTPASAMGDKLLDRLQANAGLSFEVE